MPKKYYGWLGMDTGTVRFWKVSLLLFIRKNAAPSLHPTYCKQLSPESWVDIHRRGSISAWIVILSVYGADTIAEVKLLISPFLS
jgi:hypothetical protein